MTECIQYRNDRYGAYALLEHDDGSRIWRYRDYGQYGLSDNPGAIMELGHTRDYPYEQFTSMDTFIDHIHTQAIDWVELKEFMNYLGQLKQRMTDKLKALGKSIGTPY